VANSAKIQATNCLLTDKLLMPDAVNCWIYKSPRKEAMYLYIAQEDCFDDIPGALLESFGTPAFVMQLQLDTRRKLARENTATVISNLRQQGFHLQMPPQLKPDMYHGNED